MKLDFDLARDLSRVRIVRSREGVFKASKKQRVRDVQRRKPELNVATEIFAGGDIKRRVSRHVSRAIAAQESRPIRHAAREPCSAREAQLGAGRERHTLVVIQIEVGIVW